MRVQVDEADVRGQRRTDSVARFGVVALCVLLGGLTLAFALNGWSLDRLFNDTTNSCRETEEAAFPELERVASETLQSVEYDVIRYSGCEDTGRPDPAVIADVAAWERASFARALLVDAGWTLTAPPNGYRSPDGQTRANISRLVSTPRRVMVAFHTNGTPADAVRLLVHAEPSM